MSSKNDGVDANTTISAIGAIANSKAAEKLAHALAGLVQFPQNVLDYAVGPKRISAISDARSAAVVAEAKALAEADRIRAEAANFLLDREIHKAKNREAIVAEAQKALPPPEAVVADEQVSPDFVHQFFEEFDGISDPEVHKIVGRLLAGEVVRPGSFPRRTMRVLRDLESADFAKFTALCSVCWAIGGPQPLVFDPGNAIYSGLELSFDAFVELEALGLITFDPLGGYARHGFEAGKKVLIAYQGRGYLVDMKPDIKELSTGNVILTDAGRRLSKLVTPRNVAGFVNYVASKWKDDGHRLLNYPVGDEVLPATTAQNAA